jgi:hypothetical protein
MSAEKRWGRDTEESLSFDKAAANLPEAPKTMYVLVNGVQGGPYNGFDMKAVMGSGAVGRQTLAWEPGMAQWGPLGDLPKFGAAAREALPEPGQAPASSTDLALGKLGQKLADRAPAAQAAARTDLGAKMG